MVSKPNDFWSSLKQGLKDWNQTEATAPFRRRIFFENQRWSHESVLVGVANSNIPSSVSPFLADFHKIQYFGLKSPKRKQELLRKIQILQTSNPLHKLDTPIFEKSLSGQSYAVKKDGSFAPLALSHSQQRSIGFHYPICLPIGLDMEFVGTKSLSIAETVLSHSEQTLAVQFPRDQKNMPLVLWTAKEAISKLLGKGLTFPFSLLEISEIQTLDSQIFSLSCKHFPNLKVISILEGSWSLSLAFQRETSFHFVEE